MLSSLLSSLLSNKLGLVKCTSASGITQWIKDDVKVIESFNKNDGKRKPVWSSSLAVAN